MQQISNRERREPPTAMLGERAHPPDAAHPELASAEALTEVAVGGHAEDAIAVERTPESVEGELRSAMLDEPVVEVQRDPQDVGDLVAVFLRGRPDLGHRSTSHAHGEPPHFGHPSA